MLPCGRIRDEPSCTGHCVHPSAPTGGPVQGRAHPAVCQAGCHRRAGQTELQAECAPGPKGEHCWVVPPVAFTVRDACSKLRCWPPASSTGLGGWEAGRRELQFEWSEAGFPGRKDCGGTVTLNNVACKPEIGLPGKAHQRQAKEREAGGAGGGRIPPCRQGAPAYNYEGRTRARAKRGPRVSPASGGGGVAEWQACGQLAFLRAPRGACGGSSLRHTALEASAETCFDSSLKFTTRH